jgi:hypothetical protein
VRPTELIRDAKEIVSELTGMEAENVTGLTRDGDGWIVTVEVLEVPRVPSTMDVLGTYEITLSDGGGIVGFRRLRRHHRAATEEEN